MGCIDLHDYKMNVRLHTELSIDDTVGYTSVPYTKKHVLQD
jgi:hypothetical protein